MRTGPTISTNQQFLPFMLKQPKRSHFIQKTDYTTPERPKFLLVSMMTFEGFFRLISTIYLEYRSEHVRSIENFDMMGLLAEAHWNLRVSQTPGDLPKKMHLSNHDTLQLLKATRCFKLLIELISRKIYVQKQSSNFHTNMFFIHIFPTQHVLFHCR